MRSSLFKDGYAIQIVDKESTRIENFYGKQTDIDIEYFDIKDVRRNIIEISSRAFRDTLIENLIIHGNVKSIGPYAFERCTRLKKVVIMEGVTEIGQSAFASCKSLKEVILPGTVKRINPGTFRNCHSLEKVIMPGKRTNIAIGAFDNCENLEVLENYYEGKIPSRILELGFTRCPKLRQ